MELKDFLKAILPTTGSRYFIGTVDAASRFKQRPAATILDAQKLIESYKTSAHDIYIATGSYIFNGKRTAANVVSKKCFYLDLDCGEGKPFADKNVALFELLKWRKRHNLPKISVLVDSGNGIHAYWLLRSSVTADEWKPVAEALKDLCGRTGFQADEAVTADLTRILRVPTTENHKHGEVKECKILRSFNAYYELDELAKAFGIRPATHPGLPINTEGDLSGGMAGAGYAQQTYYFKDIVSECAMCNNILSTGGAEETETNWRNVLFLLTFCEDGEDYIHKVSDQHPGYSEAATDRKYTARLEGKGTLGPTKCTTFKGYHPELCGGCPHFSTTSSPLHLGVPPANTIPFPYKQDKQGIYIEIDGAKERIWGFNIKGMALTHDVEEGVVMHFNAKMGRSHGVDLPVHLLADKRQLATLMSKFGAPVTPTQSKGFEFLMERWHAEMTAARKVRTSISKLGWSADRAAFSTGTRVFRADKTEETVSKQGGFKQAYDVEGRIEPWRAAQDYVLNQPDRQDLHTVLATGYAAPLMVFTEQHCGIISIVSAESGLGKTTAMKIAQGIWADPIRAMHSMQDTENSVNSKLGFSNSLPAYWDEVRTYDGKQDFIKTLFQFSQGREKTRLSANSRLMSAGEWTTLITLSSNEHIAEFIEDSNTGSDAPRYRIFEIEALPHASADAEAAQAIFRATKGHYGHAGLVYGKWLAEHANYVKSVIDKVTSRYMQDMKATHQERFWVATCSCILAGAMIAKKLELADFDVKSLDKYLKKEFRAQRRHTSTLTATQVGAKSAESVLQEYILKVGDQTICTATAPKPKCGAPDIIRMPSRSPIVAQKCEEEGELRLEIGAFRAWLRQSGHAPGRVINGLEQKFPWIEKRRLKLTTSIGTQTTPVPALVLHLSAAGMLAEKEDA